MRAHVKCLKLTGWFISRFQKPQKNGIRSPQKKLASKRKSSNSDSIKVAQNFSYLRSPKKNICFIFDPPKFLKVKTFINLFQCFR